ncbi:MAG: hypothetical protein M0C28_45980 [Candidatus Moduliflexus flocculans]|nr:hypothetical protein [Candidatus Moduliflexus flocculans]
MGLGYIGPDRFYGWEWEPEAQRQVLVDAKNSVIATFAFHLPGPVLGRPARRDRPDGHVQLQSRGLRPALPLHLWRRPFRRRHKRPLRDRFARRECPHRSDPPAGSSGAEDQR